MTETETETLLVTIYHKDDIPPYALTDVDHISINNGIIIATQGDKTIYIKTWNVATSEPTPPKILASELQ
jgi:hypothetical protein